MNSTIITLFCVKKRHPGCVIHTSAHITFFCFVLHSFECCKMEKKMKTSYREERGVMCTCLMGETHTHTLFQDEPKPTKGGAASPTPLILDTQCFVK